MDELQEPQGIQITEDTINAIIQATNLADEMKPRELDELGSIVCEEFLLDDRSREKWLDEMREATDLARQVYDKKVDATGLVVANVKMPIIGSAIIQFSSRAYPNIVKGKSVVKGKVIGKDPDGAKASRAGRVSDYMNYQILEEMEEWESETDLLLTLLALNGSMLPR